MLLISTSNVSLSVTLVAVTGPAFTISSVYVSTLPAGTVARSTALSTDRSAAFGEVLLVTVFVMVLLPRFGSPTFGLTVVSVAEFTSEPAAVASTVSTIGGVATPDVSGAPAVKVRSQVMAFGPLTGSAGEQLQPLSVMPVTVTFAGRSSVITIVPKNALGPLFVARSVQLNGTPTTASPWLGPVLLIERSACGSSSVAPPSVAVLLPRFGSVGAAALMETDVTTPAPALAIVTGIEIVPSA